MEVGVKGYNIIKQQVLKKYSSYLGVGAGAVVGGAADRAGVQGLWEE